MGHGRLLIPRSDHAGGSMVLGRNLVRIMVSRMSGSALIIVVITSGLIGYPAA